MLRLDAVSKRHGPQILFLEASAALSRGEKVGLVGPNGAGKTTLFRLLTREEEPDDGQVAIDRGTTLGYFSQDIGEMKGQSVVEAALDGAGPVSQAAHALHELEHALADPDRADELDALVERFGHAQARFEELGGYALESRAREVLAGLGFEAAQMDGDVGALSGGWKMRIGLARILVMQPDVLLLDEPTNHLDLESIIWLEGWLRDFQGALLMTSHDVEFLNRCVTRILEIDGGEILSYSGDYDFYARQRTIAEREQAAQFARQQAMLAKEEAFIARFKARASHAAQVQSRVKKLEKIERVEPPRRRQTVHFEFRPAPRSGDDVTKLAGVQKAYGERVVFAGLDLLIRRRERWCVMGANGAGKSTLLKLVAGAAEPDAGKVALGAGVKLGYFAQHSMEVLDADDTVYETLEKAFPGASVGSLRTLAGCFGFPGDDIQKRCRLLSGGEKVRLVLARMLYDPPNFLVLDEPTNHLDLATREMLIEALAAYEGTLLLVSHDRRFLSALTDRVLELEAGRPPRVYGGGYAEYVAASGHEAPGMRS
ncbi:MAG TPA: ABC-F family ATP-binding cassette domain-containing protein [Myxococcota bacterium]|nr:ABC-F family ATP-binding cassette domain-containing protein [Myxococcota bacterium]